MPSPFPGMDPWLEHPDLWPDVHNSVIAAIRDILNPLLRPRYVARLEERTYLVEPEGLVFVGRADVTVSSLQPDRPPAGLSPVSSTALVVEVPVPDRIRETWLEIRATSSGEAVTVLELLSPTNKRPGEGRRRYEEKRLAVLGTRTNLVEIDLVRAGEPMLVYGADRTADYRILVSRGDRRPRAELLLFGVREPIPSFRLPLRGEEEEPTVDIGQVLKDLYDRAGYDLSIDYGSDAVPPLAPPDRDWAEALLRH
ncbi:MAG: DUF4058 family protein [Armatimonadetes bacterium]|nr:DUF4058 family protein [Armatimonadota bacterium]